MRCSAVLATQWRHQQPWLKCCENQATMRWDGVPLCGTHINSLPAAIMVSPAWSPNGVEKL